jgi:hypothetical protein
MSLFGGNVRGVDCGFGIKIGVRGFWGDKGWKYERCS